MVRPSTGQHRRARACPSRRSVSPGVPAQRPELTSPARADRAIAYLLRTPLRRVELPVVASRTWQLRTNLPPYDAAYVALAELLSAPLVTSDGRLARATGPRCVIELIQAGRAD